MKHSKSKNISKPRLDKQRHDSGSRSNGYLYYAQTMLATSSHINTIISPSWDVRHLVITLNDSTPNSLSDTHCQPNNGSYKNDGEQQLQSELLLF
jgi:hypothetical protein